jgi:hypothetical protein
MTLTDTESIFLVVGNLSSTNSVHRSSGDTVAVLWICLPARRKGFVQSALNSTFFADRTQQSSLSPLGSSSVVTTWNQMPRTNSEYVGYVDLTALAGAKFIP